MKKTRFTIVFYALLCFLAAVSSFAQNISNDFIFIEGTSERGAQQEFFQTNFTIEAAGAGYTVTKTRNEASHTFRFVISANTYTDDRGNTYLPPSGDNQYVMKISLIRNSDNEEILNFDFYFTELLEMYEYTQFIFNRATVYIPPSARETVIQVEKIVQVPVDREVEVLVEVEAEIDRTWQNKWLYAKISANYPIAFFQLQSTGLFADMAVFVGQIESPSEFMPLDHKIFPQPGLTAGIEFQFFNFMSLEVNFQLNLGDPLTYYFINMAAAAELKFNIKTKYLMIQPYGAFLYPVNVSDIFKEFPLFAAGGGAEVSVSGGKNGAFFLDVNFLYFFPGDAQMNNPYGDLFPEPTQIHYKHFRMGLGIGYKFGFFDRKPFVPRAPRNREASPDEAEE